MHYLYAIDITQRDCPHIAVSKNIRGLRVFVLGGNPSGSRMEMVSLFASNRDGTVDEALRFISEQDHVGDLDVLVKKGNAAICRYSIARTEALHTLMNYGQRLYPFIASNGIERWMFISDEPHLERKVHDTEMTKITGIRRLSSEEFLDLYLYTQVQVWKAHRYSGDGFEGYRLIAESVALGYFDWPRRVSLSEMSKRLNVPRTTLTYRIRKAERDVLNDILDL